MSSRAILLATEAELRARFDDPDGRIVTAGSTGRPPALAGQVAVVVSPGGSRSVGESVDGGDDRAFDVVVSITHRVAYAPRDRRGARAAANTPRGALELAEELPHWLVGNYRLLKAANALLGATEQGFFEPFNRATIGAIEEPGEDWLSGQSGEGETGVEVVRVTLSGARRIRPFEHWSAVT